MYSLVLNWACDYMVIWLYGFYAVPWQILQIPENPNPKSGIVPGSCSFEEMLSAVADFKAPVSEPGGSMQQGMYTPKGELPFLLC